MSAAKPFREFEEQFSFDKLAYDLNQIAPQLLKQSSELFTQEQYELMTATMASMILATLQQYHEWLSEMHQ